MNTANKPMIGGYVIPEVRGFCLGSISAGELRAVAPAADAL